MPIVEFSPESDNDEGFTQRISPQAPASPKIVPEEDLMRAFQGLAQDTFGEELTVEQEEVFLDVYRRLESRAIRMNNG